MAETAHPSGRDRLSKLWYAVRMLIVLMLIAFVYGALAIYVPYRRDWGTFQQLRATAPEGLVVDLQYRGPSWIPLSVRDKTRIFDRVASVNLMGSGSDADLALLRDFSDLKSLSIEQSTCTDAGFANLEGMTTLESLRVVRTPITDEALNHIGSLKKLRSLVLSELDITDTGLSHVKGLTNLAALHLNRTFVTDQGLTSIAGLKNLIVLDLGSTGVTDRGLDQLKGLTNLQLLQLAGTSTTPAARARLRKSLPKCVIEPDW